MCVCVCVCVHTYICAYIHCVGGWEGGGCRNIKSDIVLDHCTL